MFDVYSARRRRVLACVPATLSSINGNQIRTVDDMTAVLEAGRGLAWRLEIERNGALLRQFVR